MLPTYERAFVGILEERFRSRDVLIQVLIGPRQVGKTTGVKQLLQRWNGPFFMPMRMVYWSVTGIG